MTATELISLSEWVRNRLTNAEAMPDETKEEQRAKADAVKKWQDRQKKIDSALEKITDSV